MMIAAVLLLLTNSLLCTCQCLVPKLTRLTDPVIHTEGPHWSIEEQVLYYVSTPGQTIFRYDPKTRKLWKISFNKPVSIVVPIRGERNKFMVTLGRELVVLTWDWNSGFYSISPPLVIVDQQSPKNLFNDGKADSLGRIWAGTLGEKNAEGDVEPWKGSLYRVNNDRPVPCRADLILRPVSISNGLAWSSDDKTFYFADTPTRKIEGFDFDLVNGVLSNRRTVFDFGDVKGEPDGITIDADDNLWIACLGGFQVIQVNPSTGKLLRQVKMPVEKVSSVVFGGPCLKTLFVTTIREYLTPQQLQDQPYAGSVFMVTGLNVTGTVSKQAYVNCKCNY